MHYDVTLMTCKAKEQKAKRPDKAFSNRHPKHSNLADPLEIIKDDIFN